MAITITFGNQKGGVGKSTTAAATAFLLSDMGYNVLAIDMDSQSNMIQILANTDDLLQYEDKTIKEALELGDVRPYVLSITDHLHFIPSDDFLVLINENRNIYLLRVNCLFRQRRWCVDNNKIFMILLLSTHHLRCLNKQLTLLW